MSLDTVAMAYPIDEADLLAPALGDELVGSYYDTDSAVVPSFWVDGRNTNAEPWTLLGSTIPGDVWFEFSEDLRPPAWLDMYAMYTDVLSLPLEGDPDLGLDVRRTPKGTRACAGQARKPETATGKEPCKRAALGGSAFCGSHHPVEDGSFG